MQGSVAFYIYPQKKKKKKLVQFAQLNTAQVTGMLYKYVTVCGK